MNRSFIVKNIFKYIAGFLLLGLLSCSDSGNSSSPEETSKAICIGNAFERNKTITAILDECSVSINDILEANIEGINLSSCSRNDVISHSDKTILELSAECGEIVPISSSSASEKACYYPETEQCFEGDYTVCPGAGGELMDQCPSTGDVSSSSGTTESSSSSLEQEFKYCVFEADKTCLQGTEPVTECPPGGDLSNSCPYGASSSSTKGESSSSATTPF
ncbi:MAG: hypothetical protein LBR60_04485, partial [Fibrobacter sp.]|nr:hypothetical protein [Fibrobacter sp.]